MKTTKTSGVSDIFLDLRVRAVPRSGGAAGVPGHDGSPGRGGAVQAGGGRGGRGGGTEAHRQAPHGIAIRTVNRNWVDGEKCVSC